MKLIILIVLVAASSCGLLMRHAEGEYYDADIHKERLAAVNARPEVRKRDSLMRMIEAAPLQIPADLIRTTLVAELYCCDDYLKAVMDKFSGPSTAVFLERQFRGYDRMQKTILKKYKHKSIYAYKAQLDTMNRTEYRYVLKAISKLLTTDEQITHIDKDGDAPGRGVTILVFYIYDRVTGEVFREISGEELDEVLPRL